MSLKEKKNMGGGQSRETIVKHANEISANALTEISSNCTSDSNITQILNITCDPTNIMSNSGVPYENNNACTQ
jgi:hypothetical protein